MPKKAKVVISFLTGNKMHVNHALNCKKKICRPTVFAMPVEGVGLFILCRFLDEAHDAGMTVAANAFSAQ